MLTLTRALQSDETSTSSSTALAWNVSSVQFDATLVDRLVDQYADLSKRFDAVVDQLGSAPDLAERSLLDCIEQLNQLRHIEALRIYPIISRGLSADPVARRLFWQARVVMLGLARRVLRRFEELIRALRSGWGIAMALDHAATALAEYRQRNETEMCPLYNLAGRRGGAAPQLVPR